MEYTPRLIAPIGHSMAVTAVAFSPEGDFVLTGSVDGTAKLWSRQGKEICTFERHFGNGGVTAVAFSPAAPQVLTGGYDKNIFLWDYRTGRKLQCFKSKKAEAIHSLAFSPDGSHFLAGGAKGQLCLWKVPAEGIESAGNIESPEETFSEQHTDKINGVAFAPDSKTVAAASIKDVILIDLKTRKRISLSHQDHKVNVKDVAFSPDSNQVVTASDDGTLSLWNVKDGLWIRQFIGHKKAVNSVSFSPEFPEGTSDFQFVSGSTDRSVIIWDTKSESYLNKFEGHQSTVRSVAFSPDAEEVLSGSTDKTAILWNKYTGEKVDFKGHSAPILSATFSPDGSEILLGSTKPFASVWNLEAGEIRSRLLGHNKEIRTVAYSPDGSFLLTGSLDKTVILWNAESKQKISDNYRHGKTVYSVVFAADNSFFVSGSADNKIRILDPHSNADAQILEGHLKDVRSLAISPDRKLILSGARDKKTLLWNLQARSPVPEELAESNETVRAVAFSPDGSQFLCGHSDNTVILGDTRSRKEKVRLKGHHKDDIYALGFSPDGERIISGSKDKKAVLWDLEGKKLQTFEGHKSTISTVAFAPFGPYALTGSHDCTIRLWNSENGKEIASLIQVGAEDWVVNTPSGLFDASPGAMKLMHYVVGLEVIELDQLKERYWQPGLLKTLLDDSDHELNEVKAFEDVPLYPTILTAEILGDALHLEIEERNGGIGRISLRINNKEQESDIRKLDNNENRKTKFSLSLKKYEKFFDKGGNTLSIRCWNQEGWLSGRSHELKFDHIERQEDGRSEGALYTLFIGTSIYRNDMLSLSYPDQDATYLNDAVKIVGGLLFENNVHTKLLTTEQPSSDAFSSKENIHEAFKELAGKVKPQDVVIIYFSGHGANFDDGQRAQYYYLTHDIVSSNLSDSAVRDKATISSDELVGWINDIPARKQVLIFDTCYSGKIVDSLKSKSAIDSSRNRALERMKDRTGTFVLTGSAADKVSYEASNYGQGLLTYTLLQGMKGAALMDRTNQAEKTVDVMTLFSHSREEVERLSREFSVVQRPYVRAPLNVESFDIGIAPETARRQIKLAMPKPVFERSNFMNSEHFLDDLDISETLDQYLTGSIGIGSRPEAIFIDVVNFPGAHNVRGLYAKTPAGYLLKGKVYKDQQSKGDFEVTGKSMEDLVPKIARQVEQIAFPIDDYAIPTDEEIGVLEKGRKDDLDDLKGQPGFGYDENFIGENFKVPMPVLNDLQLKDIAKSIENDDELKYQYYSVVQSKSRKFPFFAVCNLHGGEFRKLGRAGSFICDPRLSREDQWADEFYTYKFKDNNEKTIAYTKIFHRGHMAKREDTQWGKDNETAERGAKLTFFFTNAIPQHGHLNGVVWRGLEDYIMDVATDGKKAAGEDIYKINIFTGPVFQDDDPRLPIEVDGKEEQVPVPVLFWKVVYFKKKSSDKLYCIGFMMGQKTLLEEAFGAFGIVAKDAEKAKAADFLGYRDKEIFQVKVSFIEEKTKMKFPPAEDPMKNSENGRQISEVVKKVKKKGLLGEDEGLTYNLEGLIF